MRNERNIYQTARELKGLTQETAAERIGVSVDTMGAYEQDRRRPPDSTALYRPAYPAYKWYQG